MILDKIAASTRIRVAEDMARVSLEEMKERAKGVEKNVNVLPPFAFETQLKTPGIHFICEVKKASPSKGLIAPDFPYEAIAKAYQEAGADCVSVLTEPEFFQGNKAYLTAIKKVITIPVIRKDFIISDYQIYEAKAIGADCVLLICALLDKETLEGYINLAHSLGISALVEAHDEAEIQMALQAGARMIGVNNRNLKTFEVDVHNSPRLRKLVPDNIVFVAESGIKTREDIEILEAGGVNGVLIGETLMRSSNKKQMLDQLRGK